MAAQPGKDLLIKIATAAAPTAFVTVGGLTNVDVSFDGTTIDVTTADSPGRWRELLPAVGMRSMDVTGTMRFVDAASDEHIRKHWADGTTPNCQVIVPDFGTYQGPFRIPQHSFSGAHDAEVQAGFTLNSAGEITFTPEA